MLLTTDAGRATRAADGGAAAMQQNREQARNSSLSAGGVA
jgi:hypothetical protein